MCRACVIHEREFKARWPGWWFFIFPIFPIFLFFSILSFFSLQPLDPAESEGSVVPKKEGLEMGRNRRDQQGKGLGLRALE